MAVSQQAIVEALKGFAFFDLLLPWLFTFAIVYGLLRKINIFGDVNQRVSSALALVIAFFVTAFAGPQLATFFTSIFAGTSMILAGILVILLFIAMIGKEPKDIASSGALVVLIIVGVILFVLSTGATSGVAFAALASQDFIALILVMVVIIAAVYMITKTEKEGKAPPAGGGGRQGG